MPRLDTWQFPIDISELNVLVDGGLATARVHVRRLIGRELSFTSAHDHLLVEARVLKLMRHLVYLFIINIFH